MLARCGLNYYDFSTSIHVDRCRESGEFSRRAAADMGSVWNKTINIHARREVLRINDRRAGADHFFPPSARESRALLKPIVSAASVCLCLHSAYFIAGARESEFTHRLRRAASKSTCCDETSGGHGTPPWCMAYFALPIKHSCYLFFNQLRSDFN